MSDSNTGLMWVYDADDNGKKNWDQAMSLCSSLVYAGHDDWYLPSIDQLVAIYSEKSLFKDVQNEFYWSGTPHSSFSWSAVCFNMSMGYSSDGTKTSSYYVWPVRSGQ